MSPDARRAFIYGLVVTVAFVAIDLALGSHAAISGSYSLGAVVAGVIGGFAPAAVVGPSGFALAALSGLWNDDFGSAAYFARLFVAFSATLLGLGAGRLHDQVRAQLGRQQLLTAVADLPEPGASLDRTVARVVELLVPRFASYAALEGGLARDQVRLASRGTEPIDRSTVNEVPLRARGRQVGVLTVGGGRAGSDDPRFLPVLAGRIALALDNAGLSQELVTVEQQLKAILENLGEAVTVQDRGGRLVFANPAAADLLGAGSVEELLATPAEEVAARFTTVTESGEPLDLAALPGRSVLEGHRPEPLVVRSTNRKTGDEYWRIIKATPVVGAGGEVLLAVNVIEDITETKRVERAQRLLADASAALASSLDYTSTLQRVAELAVPQLADWCWVSLPRGELLEQVAFAHADPAMHALAAGYARRWPVRIDRPGGAAEVLRTGVPLIVPEVTPEMYEPVLAPEQRAELQQLGLRSVIVAPMATPERTVGLLSLVTAQSGRRFTDADVELALELARRSATAIENARLYSQLDHVATTLQTSLLPPALPEVPGWRFASLYLPAGGETDVGGDFYDVFPTAAGWVAVIGDVVGRGPAAAALTAMGRYTLRTAGSLVGTPTLGLARLNDNLRDRGGLALCTAAVVLLREGTDEAALVCAGHPHPYLIRHGQAQAVGRTGPLLGAFPRGHWLPEPVDLAPGDILVLYTDGVIDARGRNGRFGDERLERTLKDAASADQAVELIRTALLEFAGPEHEDDIAVLAMQKL